MLGTWDMIGRCGFFNVAWQLPCGCAKVSRPDFLLCGDTALFCYLARRSSRSAFRETPAHGGPELPSCQVGCQVNVDSCHISCHISCHSSSFLESEVAYVWNGLATVCPPFLAFQDVAGQVEAVGRLGIANRSICPHQRQDFGQSWKEQGIHEPAGVQIEAAGILYFNVS